MKPLRQRLKEEAINKKVAQHVIEVLNLPSSEVVVEETKVLAAKLF